MTNSTKRILTVILITVISFSANGQTTISGGMYADTTLTKANSPYTLNNVVVFPNVTLIIEPGCVLVVNGNLEIRQGTLIAEGTVTDSITFIGSLPILGDTLSNTTIYFNNALSSKLNYCIIKDNPTEGIGIRMYSASDSLIMKNSYFNNNGIGIFDVDGVVIVDSCLFTNNGNGGFQSYFTITNSILRKNQIGLAFAQGATIKNCIIDSNNLGIESEGFDTITNCQIKNNGIGIRCVTLTSYGSQIHNNIIENDSIGIQLSANDGEYRADSIYCNEICNNTTYNIKVTTIYYSNAANNYWCTSDSTTIANSIYDGYDNDSYALLNFMPIDTEQCYLATGVPIYEAQTFSFSIFPNPASNNLTLLMPENVSKGTIKIYNLLGELMYSSIITKQRTDINVASLASGIYVIEVSNGDTIRRQKFIRE